jgi:hypothetical protein
MNGRRTSLVLIEAPFLSPHLCCSLVACSRTSSKVRRASKQEEKLLRKLSKISRVMQEVRLMEGATPEMEAEMVPYTADWEGRLTQHSRQAPLSHHTENNIHQALSIIYCTSVEL